MKPYLSSSSESSVETADTTSVASMTFLSLILILLTFFIYMDSRANFDAARSNAVISSLAPQFTGLTLLGDADPYRVTRSGNGVTNNGVIAIDVAREAISQSIKKIPDATVSLAAQAITISFSLPSLFRTGDSQIRANALESLATIAGDLKYPDLTIDIQVISDEASDGSWVEAMDRGAALYRYFIDAGVPKAGISFQGVYASEETAEIAGVTVSVKESGANA